MSEGQFTYALGKRGMTRRKLEIASGAIIEYVGYMAFIAGTKYERRRAKEYLVWLLDQKDGRVQVTTKKRDADFVSMYKNMRGFSHFREFCFCVTH
jgi:hypothetical protein